MAQREKEKKEQQLRQLAQKAREERGAGITATPSGGAAAASKGPMVSYEPGSSSEESEDDEDDVTNAKERDEMRKDKKYERRRERNIARAGAGTRAKIQKADEERDISEQIALGLPSKKGGQKEVVYDQRLFNQTSGMNSGFDREDDTYNVYTERWNETGDSRVAKNLYRPKDSEEADMYGQDVEQYKTAKQFVADRGFEGAVGKSTRTGPVQFEKDQSDPFGLDDFLDKAKGGGSSAPKKARRE